MTKSEIMKLAEFPQVEAEKRATNYAEGWADFAYLPEEEQADVVYQYIESGRIENQRLRQLIEIVADQLVSKQSYQDELTNRVALLTESNEKLVEALTDAQEGLWAAFDWSDHCIENSCVPAKDERFQIGCANEAAKQALADHESRMKRLAGVGE